MNPVTSSTSVFCVAVKNKTRYDAGDGLKLQLAPSGVTQQPVCASPRLLRADVLCESLTCRPDHWPPARPGSGPRGTWLVRRGDAGLSSRLPGPGSITRAGTVSVPRVST